MSTVQMALVWPLQLDPSAKAVLVSLADQANDEGGCWPSVGTVAGRTCLSERTVQQAMARLQALGLLQVEVQASRRRTNFYTLTVRQYLAAQAAKKAIEAAQAGSSEGAQTPQQLHPAAAAPRSSCTHDPAAAAPESSLRTKTNTPIPPAGQGASGPELKPKRRQRSGAMPLADWLGVCKAAGVKPIPADDPVHEYATTVGLTPEMLLLAWREFKRVRLASGKAQADWRATFRNAVRGNWFKVWMIRGGRDAAVLTTVGEQLRRELEAEAAQAQAALRAEAERQA